MVSPMGPMYVVTGPQRSRSRSRGPRLAV